MKCFFHSSPILVNFRSGTGNSWADKVKGISSLPDPAIVEAAIDAEVMPIITESQTSTQTVDDGMLHLLYSHYCF